MMCFIFIYMKRVWCNVVTGGGGKKAGDCFCVVYKFLKQGSDDEHLKLVQYFHQNSKMFLTDTWRNQSHHCTELWTTKFWHWSNKGHSWIRHSKWHPRKTDRSLGVCYIWRPMYVFCLNLTLKQNYCMIWTPVIFLFINCTCNASKRK